MIRKMYELPLFPLNTVLFPGMPISLHIFEDRYKEMIGYCLTAHRPFGVVLIRQGVEALGPLAEPHLVGCTAHITHVQSAGEGRLNILAIGQERFRVVSLHQEQSYLTGLVETFPLPVSDSMDVVEEGTLLRPWVERYLGILSDAGEVNLDLGQLPTDPLTLAYLAAYLLLVPAEQKQPLLAAAEATLFLSDVRECYRREIAVLQAMLDRPLLDEPGLLSLN
jgi:Lon protease-like protein